MDWRKPESATEGVNIPTSWLFLHYYEGLSSLFRVENALRMFVYVVLKAAKKGRWSDLTITSDDGGETTIAAIAKRRLTQDERFGYLGYRVGSPLMHLTSGELIRVIFAESYWPSFASYFPATKEIVRTKLEEIGNIRNALAHFRPIKPDDVEVVKQNANQVLSRVEEMLARVVYLHQTVPTNTPDPWYGSFRAVAAPHFDISFQQSDDERWVQIRLTHTCPQVSAPYTTDSYRMWRVLTLIPPNILRESGCLLDHVIYGFESVPLERLIDGGEGPIFRKALDLVFSRQTLADHHQDIRADLERILAMITSETEFLLQETQARGQLVRRAMVTANKREDFWHYERAQLRTVFREDQPVEYWNRKPTSPPHLVTDTQRYPWMPVDVSREEDMLF